MRRSKQQFLDIIILVTSVFILTEILFYCLHSILDGIDFIELKILFTKQLFFSHFVFVPLLELLAAHILIISLTIYFIWLMTDSISELFVLREKNTRRLAVLLCLLSIATIVIANAYFVPHSLFTQLVLNNFLNNALSDSALKTTLIALSLLCLTALTLTLIQIFSSLFQKQRLLQNGIALSLMISLVFLLNGSPFKTQTTIITAASETRPNIIIIGFDAVRPDHLGFFDPSHAKTIAFDDFLQTATVFSNAYTPLARTYPTWTSILTAKYPLHHMAREDNADINTINLTESLAKSLKQAGYDTIFASDDNRFSYINREYGFDSVVGDRGDLTDFSLFSLHDSPLSNLLTPTPLGKLLFPYHYANHDAALTHDPNNFLMLIHEKLQRSRNNPLFLAMHFNVTAWPFEGFNDHVRYNTSSIERYASSIQRADLVLKHCLMLLKQHGLLNHAIVILISDHGFTFAQPGDKVIALPFYQGNKNAIKLKRTLYNTATTYRLQIGTFKPGPQNTRVKFDSQETPFFLDSKNYGVDASYGYGNDVLTLKQHHALLAFKSYGIKIGTPHTVADRTLVLDIAPTILDILNLPAMPHAEGISLKPYLSHRHDTNINARPIFLESGYSLPEMERDGILIDQVIKKSLSNYHIDAKTGLVSILPSSQRNVDYFQKQHAIMQGNWLLAYYPAAMRYRLLRKDNLINFQAYLAPPVMILVNLKSHRWTTEISNALVSTAPMQSLNQQLWQFYGDEMGYYKIKSPSINH